MYNLRRMGGRRWLWVLLCGILGLALASGTVVAGAAPRRVAGATRIVTTLPLPREAAASPSDVPLPKLPKSCFQNIPRADRDRREGESGNGPWVHVVYLLGSDAPDERLDAAGILDCSMRAQNVWLQQQTGMTWRLDTFTAKVGVPGTKRKVAADVLDVTFIKSTMRGDELNNAGTVSDVLRKHDLAQGDKRYLTFVAGGGEGSPCGDAYWPFDSQDPKSDGQYAQVYMLSVEGCHAHEFGVPGKASFAEAIAQQEIMHNDGMVPIGAPHGCGPFGLPAHVCTPVLWVTEGAIPLDPERVDILFPFVNLPLEEKVVDRDNDDYYGHPFPYRDLDQSPYLIEAAD